MKNRAVICAIFMLFVLPMKAQLNQILTGQSGLIDGISVVDDKFVQSKKPAGFESDSAFAKILYFWNENEGVAIGDAYPNEKVEIYTTSDGGLQWNFIPIAILPSGSYEWNCNHHLIFKVHCSSVFLRTGSGRIFQSMNKGLNWSEIDSPMKDFIFNSDFKEGDPGLLTYAIESDSYQTDDVYPTHDGGINWIFIVFTCCMIVLYLTFVCGKHIK